MRKAVARRILKLYWDGFVDVIVPTLLHMENLLTLDWME